MFDFDALKKRDRGITDAHKDACCMIYERCKSTVGGQWKMDPQSWTEEFVCCAVEVLRPSRIPLSPAMGQGLLESYYGMKKVLFGIKARQQDVLSGKATEAKTKEFINGQWENVTDYFFMDTTMRDQFGHYLDLCRRVHPNFAKFYPAKDEDYLNYILRPEKAYATDPDYKKMVLAIIKNIGLTVFDDFSMYGPVSK